MNPDFGRIYKAMVDGYDVKDLLGEVYDKTFPNGPDSNPANEIQMPTAYSIIAGTKRATVNGIRADLGLSALRHPEPSAEEQADRIVRERHKVRGSKLSSEIIPLLRQSESPIAEAAATLIQEQNEVIVSLHHLVSLLEKERDNVQKEFNEYRSGYSSEIRKASTRNFLEKRLR